MSSAQTNREVAALFAHIADLLEIKGENRFKVQAYRRAADNIANLGQSLFELWQSGQNLKDIAGVGQAIADKLDELFQTGHLQFWEKLTAEVPESLIEVLAVPDVGPKLVKTMWQEWGLATVAELKAAAQEGRLRTLPRMGEKREARILANIEALERREPGRVHLGVAWPLARQVVTALRDLPDVYKLEAAGSLRRMRETVGDLDFLVATEKPEAVMAAFKNLPGVETILLSGTTKTSVRFGNGLQADLRCLEPAHWGTALQYFTGSQSHNIRLRELAQKQGYSLSEYALTRNEDEQPFFFEEETELYQFLGLSYVPPYLREDRGEIGAALQDELPILLKVDDIKGEVHCHSTWSDGAAGIEEMARTALQRGYQYLAITDHSQSLGVANGLSVERLEQQRQEIEAVQARVPDIRLWQGTEMEVKADGTLDYPDEVLSKLDFVVASVHTGLRQDRETLTRRAQAAIRNPHVKLLAHPTGRLLTQREGGDFDMEAIFQAAVETGTMLEINASPQRLDLSDVHVRRAIELGVKLLINCDAHHPDEFNHLHFGVATAARGWATPEDVVNTRSVEEFEEMIVRG